MRRYRRYRRYGRRRSTNTIRMKFQSFMDISTSDESMQIITISAGGQEILRRLAPQFGAYKYYKIGNISVKLVPASTLPVDPTGLSYEAGENTVDPRDQLRPGLMRITNGEDVFENITGLSADAQNGIFDNMLLDPRWYKWMLQTGVKRHATPRYWQIGQLHQDKWPGSIINVPSFSVDAEEQVEFSGTQTEQLSVTVGASYDTAGASGSSSHGLFQTGHRGVLGWLPTDGLSQILRPGADSELLPFIASPPEVEVMKIILPKAYKTKYYYRMFITETVYFKEPIVNFGVPSGVGQSVYRPLDVFHYVNEPIPRTPDVPSVNLDLVEKTGGNYGDN